MENELTMTEKEEDVISHIPSEHLQQMVNATNTLKIVAKSKKPLPDYALYLDIAKELNIAPPPEISYNFARDLISTGQTAVMPNHRENILLNSGRIVEAKLIANFRGTRMYMYNGQLVVTCPTQIELMSEDISQIFPGLQFREIN